MSDISMGTIAKANGDGESAMQLDLIQNVAVSISSRSGAHHFASAICCVSAKVASSSSIAWQVSRSMFA